MNKTLNQKAWLFVIPVVILVAFTAAVPLMTVVNYSFQETFSNNVLLGKEQDGSSKYLDQIDFMLH